MRRENFWKIVIACLVGAFAVAYALLSLVRHWRFESFGFDLGLYDQALWLYSRGAFPVSTLKSPPIPILGDHFAPSFALFAFVYRFWPNVNVLLFLQALAVSLGAIPVFLLGKKIIGKFFPAFALALAYLLFFGTQRAVVFDVHMITFAAALLPWVFYFLHEGKLTAYWLAFLLTLGFKEDAGIILFAVGLFAGLRYRRWRLGIISMAVSAVWFLGVTKLVMPALAGSFPYASVFPRNLQEFWAVLSVPPDKWEAVFWSFFSFAFLPLLGWEALPLAAVHFFVHWLDPRFFGRWEMNLHYRVILAPVLAMGAILGMRRLKKYTVYPAVAVLAALAVSQYFLHLPLNMLAKPEYYRREARFNGAEALIKKIPPGASVIAQNNFVPHLSGRERIYPLVRWGKKFAPEDSPCAPKTECAWLGFAGVDYILVDFTAGQNPNNFWGADLAYTREAIENMVRTGWYNLEERRGEVELYRLR